MEYEEKEKIHKSKSLYLFGNERGSDEFKLLEDKRYISLYRIVDRQIELLNIYKIYEISEEDYGNLIELVKSI